MPETSKTKQFKQFNWPLNGKLRKDVDPTLIGETNFQELVNLRYAADCPKCIGGMTKANASPFSNTTVNSGFHFVKDQPTGIQESHVFVQTTDSGVTTSDFLKSNNTALPPNQDTYASFQTLTTTNKVFASTAPKGAMIINDGVLTNIWGGQEYECGAFFNYDPSGSFLYDYTDQIQNTLSDSLNLAVLHSIGGSAYIYVGATRPLQGVKFYVQTANGSTATATAYQWTGSAFSALSITDGTATSGKTLAETGEISFTSTVTTSKITEINFTLLYYYQFVFTGISAGTSVYYCTVDAPNQPLVDVWDGNQRTAGAYILSDVTESYYTDIVINISDQDYDANNPNTYWNAYSVSNDDRSFFGSPTQLRGFYFELPDNTFQNQVLNSYLVVYYWNGSAWVSVGAIIDTTSLNGTTTLNHSGYVTWNQQDLSLEMKTTIDSQGPLYFYSIQRVGGVYSANFGQVRVDYIGGIPCQTTINPHRFSIEWQNRLWLFDEINKQRNAGTCSASGTNCVFNGDDSVTKEFGDDSRVIAAQTLFSRFSSSIYEDLVVFKRNAVFLLDGTAIDNSHGGVPWTIYTVSDTIGLLAESTLCKCDVSYEVASGITKHVLVWRSERGIEFYDGNTLDPSLSDDIKNFFDQTKREYINPNTYSITQESAFFDNINSEYHWIFTNIDGVQEWACDLVKKRWFQVNRGAKYLTYGFDVKDPNGYQYIYGGTSDGYLERLENGTDFDGVPITWDMWSGDIMPAKSTMMTTKIRHYKFMAIQNSNSVTINHYKDGVSIEDNSITQSMTSATSRISQIKNSLGQETIGTFHSFRFTGTNTGSETPAFEPLLFGGIFEVIREDI